MIIVFFLLLKKHCLSNPPNCWIPILIIIIISACYSDHRHQRHLFKRPDEGDLSNVFGRELVGLLVCLPYYSELVGMVNLLVCWYGELVRRKSWNLRRPVNIVTAASLDSSDHSKCCQLTNRVINSSGTHRCFLYNGIVSEPMKGCRWQQLYGSGGVELLLRSSTDSFAFDADLPPLPLWSTCESQEGRFPGPLGLTPQPFFSF